MNKIKQNKPTRPLLPDEIILETDEMRRGLADEFASSNDWFKMPSQDVGQKAKYFIGSTFEIRRPL